MMLEWLRRLRRLSRRLWVRVLLVASCGPLGVFLARFVEPFLPEGSADLLGAEAVGRLLDIMASSMLTVTTFSVGAMVTAQFAASGQLTHRAHRTLMGDTTTQTTLATFVGAWIYSLAAIVVVSTPYFGERELVALFLVTLLVLALIVATTLRWIVHLQAFGSLRETSARMEREAVAAIRGRIDRALPPFEPADVPAAARAVHADRSGYVQHVGEQSLEAAAAAEDARVWLLATPGRFVVEGQVLARIDPGSGALAEAVLGCVSVGPERTTEQDPRFAVIQLSEIASKALSPGVNDPGTAIEILGLLARVLLAWEAGADAGERATERVRALPVSPQAIVSDAFDAVARDGAGLVEVQVAVQKRIAALARHADPALRPALEAAGARAYDRARAALADPSDRERLRLARESGVRE